MSIDTLVYTTTIRGIEYNKGDGFWCQVGATGNKNSAGTSDIYATVEYAQHCTFQAYDYSGVKYPYLIGDPSGSAIGWFGEEIFPYGVAYTIIYEGNADGVTNVPVAQTKIEGQDLTISTDIPVRSGYEFQGWRALYTDGTRQDYSAGDIYSVESSATLWAKWGAIVTYYPNSDSVTNMPEAQTKIYQSDLTLSNTVPVRTGYRFRGWATSEDNANAGTVAYASGATYTEEKTLNLYAVWSVAYDEPDITNITVTRCDEEGNASAIGKFLNIKFNWSVDDKLSVESLTISGSINETISVGGLKSGNVDDKFGGDLNPLHDHDILITIKDTDGMEKSSSYKIEAEEYSHPIIKELKVVRTNDAKEEDKNGENCLITFDYEIDPMRDNSNSLSGMAVGYREHGSGTGYVNEVAVDFNWDGYNKASAFANNINKDKAYDFIIIVEDQVSYTEEHANVTYAFYTMDFKAGGEGIAIGKAATNNRTFDVDMYTWFRRPVTMDVVDVREITIASRKYGENQILWEVEDGEDGYYMYEGQTAELKIDGYPSKISKQPHGIVLVFSHYDNVEGKADDTSWSTHFVPKEMVKLNNGGGQTFLMPINAGLSTFGSKYLYIYDDRIVGHVTNDKNGTAESGITFRNQDYVLRYVIGV